MIDVKLTLTQRELSLIIIGMTSAQYPLTIQKEAFELVMKLRDVIRDIKLD